LLKIGVEILRKIKGGTVAAAAIIIIIIIVRFIITKNITIRRIIKVTVVVIANRRNILIKLNLKIKFLIRKRRIKSLLKYHH
jgi:hypothetical protein